MPPVTQMAGAPGAYGSREQVLRLQQQLKAAGFDPGPIDGIMGPKTQAAQAAYQAAGSKPMGIAGRMQNLGLPAPGSQPAAASGGGGSGGGMPSFSMPQASSGPDMSQIDAIARQLALQEQSGLSQLAYQQEQENLGRAQQRNTLLSQIPVLQQMHQARERTAGAQIGDITSDLQRSLAEQQRQGTFAKAGLQDQMIGRGLGQSGVRLGAEGRQQADLVQRQGDTTLAAQRQTDAINRALTEFGTGAMSQAQQLMAQANQYNPLEARPAAPSLDELIGKYRKNLGGS